MDITVKDLERYLSHNYGSWAKEQSLFMKLVEEIGEVAEVLNKRSGREHSDEVDLTEKLASELVDVIHYAVAIAAVNEIDLTETILAKDKKASVKYNRDINLEIFLAQKDGSVE